MSQRRLSVMVKWPPAMTVTRVSVRHLRLCYIITTNKVITYPRGRSKVVYIGTTRHGVDRLASSAATRAASILGSHGITHFEVHVVTCAARQHVRTWWKLERALLISFKQRFGRTPLVNSYGRSFRESNEFHYFARSRIRAVLEDIG